MRIEDLRSTAASEPAARGRSELIEARA